MTGRFVVLLLLCCFLPVVVPALAQEPVAASADAEAVRLQQELQLEIQRMQKDAAMLSVEGQVRVTRESGMLVAEIPTLVITSHDSSRWSVAGMRLYFNGTGTQVIIRLPAAISYRDRAGRSQDAITIGTQNLTGIWNKKGSFFDSVTGTLGAVNYVDQRGGNQASILSLALDAGNSHRPVLVAANLRGKSEKDGKVASSGVERLQVEYRFPDDKPAPLTLTRLIGLFNPVWLLVDGDRFTVSFTAQNAVYGDTLARMTTVGRMQSRLQLLSRGEGSLLGGRVWLEVHNMNVQPEQAYSFVMPKKLTMLGTVAQLPLEILGQPFSMAQQAMIQAGTRTDISEIIWETSDRARLSGSGWLRAAAGVPLGMTGRLTLTLENLRVLSAALQKRLTMPGTDIKERAQGLMLVMLLQGLSRNNGEQSEVVLDLTADGEVLVNGQNISGLLPVSERMGAGLSGALDGAR